MSAPREWPVGTAASSNEFKVPREAAAPTAEPKLAAGNTAAPLLPLALDKVSFIAGERTILDAVSVTIRPGERTVVLGANGAGKSVLLRIAHGLLAPTSGVVSWQNPELPGKPRRQAMVFQRPVLLRRSALGNLTFALRVAGVPRAARADLAHRALARVGLERFAERPARVLSGGEQQRLALARAWMLKPEVLFLDEPTANLDPSSSREVEQVIQAIHEAGTKIVLVTHNLGQARRLGDEILFLDRGRLIERTPATRFFQQPATVEAAAFLEGELPWR
jgi:tungstate transport system ATP-binding protein